MKRYFLYVALIALLPGPSTRAGVLYAAGAKQQAAVAQKAPAANPPTLSVRRSARPATPMWPEVQRQPALEAGAEEPWHGRDLRELSRARQGPRRWRRRRHKIVQLSKLSPKDLDATCLGCHAGAHPNFLRSPHAKAGVSCTSCHSVHNGDMEAKLLKAAQPQLCFQCHADVKPAFDMPFHHRVNEGLIKCSDCHDPHGTFGNNNIRSTADQNAICTSATRRRAGRLYLNMPR